MPSKKKDIAPDPANKHGKKTPGAHLQDHEITVKYTFERSKEDIKKIDKIRKYLNSNGSYKSYKADSKIYRDLPDLFLNAVKEKQDQALAIDELTAKIQDLQQLKDHICRILEICKGDKPKARKKLDTKICGNFDTDDKNCFLHDDECGIVCTGYNTDCKDYELGEEP